MATCYYADLHKNTKLCKKKVSLAFILPSALFHSSWVTVRSYFLGGNVTLPCTQFLEKNNFVLVGMNLIYVLFVRVHFTRTYFAR